jgi:leucyl-tRNA synthetase
MGYDAFGLPAEQKAIDEGILRGPTDEAIQNRRRLVRGLLVRLVARASTRTGPRQGGPSTSS